MSDSIEGEKIECSGHYMSKVRECLRSKGHGHHGKCVTIKRGKCWIEKKFRWKNKKT